MIKKLRNVGPVVGYSVIYSIGLRTVYLVLFNFNSFYFERHRITRRHYSIKRNPGNGEDVIVRKLLPPEVCQQHLQTNLALEMKERQQYDFVDLFYNPEIPKFDSLLRHHRSTTSRQISIPVTVFVSPKIISIQFTDQSAEMIAEITTKWRDKRILTDSNTPVIKNNSIIWTPEFSCPRVNCGDSKVGIAKYGQISTSKQYRVKSKAINEYLLYPFKVKLVRFELPVLDSFGMVKLEINQHVTGITLLANFQQNSLWNVISTDVFVNDTDDHSKLVLQVAVKRKLDFSLYLISPVILFIIMIPLGFIIPCEF